MKQLDIKRTQPGCYGCFTVGGNKHRILIFHCNKEFSAQPMPFVSLSAAGYYCDTSSHSFLLFYRFNCCLAKHFPLSCQWKRDTPPVKKKGRQPFKWERSHHFPESDNKVTLLDMGLPALYENSPLMGMGLIFFTHRFQEKLRLPQKLFLLSPSLMSCCCWERNKIIFIVFFLWNRIYWVALIWSFKKTCSWCWFCKQVSCLNLLVSYIAN